MNFILSKCDFLKKIGKDRFVILLVTGVLLLLSCKKYDTNKQPDTKQINVKNDYSISKDKEDDDNLNDDSDKETDVLDDYISKTETRVEKMLSKMSGVGKTDVMIMLESSEEIIVEKDRPYFRENENSMDSADDNRSVTNIKNEENTVFWRDEDGNETPFIRKRNMPQITGVLVVCQGGDDTYVIKEIKESLQALFNIEAHKIKVVKMNNK